MSALARDLIHVVDTRDAQVHLDELKDAVAKLKS